MMDIRSVKTSVRQTIPFYLAGAFLLLGMKAYYSRADCAGLSWILSPTVWWVSALSGISFIKDPRAGYVSHTYRFIIAPSCSGFRFLMISAAALIFSYIHRMRGRREKAAWMAISIVASYLLTIFVNGFRILFSIFLPIYLGMAGTAHGELPAATPRGWLTPERLHTMIGTAVYFSSLFGICQLGEYVSQKCAASPIKSPHGSGQSRAGCSLAGTVRGWAVPSFWYFTLVLGIPVLNRAYRTRPGAFADYALLLTAVCLTIITFHGICTQIRRHAGRRKSG